VGNLLYLFNAILVLAILYALAIFMVAKKSLAEEHSLVLARIVTDLCLPAIIFVSLARQRVHLKDLSPALVMLGLELTCIVLAWGASRLFGLSIAQTGAVVFCSAFGSSTFLGYPVILEMFPHKAQAMTEAVLISEIGVGYPIFILGPILGSYFGKKAKESGAMWSASLGFFKSPVFFALILGIIWGVFRLPGEESIYLAPLFKVLHILAAALTPLAILAVGLMFKIPKIKTILIPLMITIMIKLILKPVAAGGISQLLSFPDLWQEVLVLLAAMPSAVLGAVFLRRYGGDASLASVILLVVTLISAVTLMGVFWFIG